MPPQYILAVIQNDLQLICALRTELERNGLAQLSVARSTQEAILYLRGVGIYANRRQYPFPSIVVFDCENPDGADLEVLAWMRETGPYKKLPAVLLCAEKHCLGHVSCALDPACYLVNRAALPELLDTIRNINSTALLAAISRFEQSSSHPSLAR